MSSAVSNVDFQYQTYKGGLVSFLAELILLSFLMTYSIVKSLIDFILPRYYKDISRDIVLITGGGRGLGRLLAVEFTKYKPKAIVLWGRSEDALIATAKAVKLHGVPCFSMVCDVGDSKQVFEQAKRVMKEVGVVTILVNNAAVVTGKSIMESSASEIQQTITTNTLGQFWTIKAFLPAMLDLNHGHIVSMNSTLGLMGLGKAADYCASKYANRALSESLLLEVLREGKPGIHVTDVHPGQTNTEMFAGFDHRFSSVFPPLDKEYVASRTVKAVLQNKREVIMPKILHIFYFLKSILPVEAILQIYRFLGLHKAMDNFHGNKFD